MTCGIVTVIGNSLPLILPRSRPNLNTLNLRLVGFSITKLCYAQKPPLSIVHGLGSPYSIDNNRLTEHLTLWSVTSRRVLSRKRDSTAALNLAHAHAFNRLVRTESETALTSILVRGTIHPACTHWPHYRQMAERFHRRAACVADIWYW